MGHYVEDTGDGRLRFLEMLKSSYFADISLNQWMALTPAEMVADHLHLSERAMRALRKEKQPVVRRGVVWSTPRRDWHPHTDRRR